MGDAFIIGSREAIILLAGAAVLLGTAFVAGRVLRSLRHGFSIRLQLFLAIFATATLSSGSSCNSPVASPSWLTRSGLSACT